MRGRSRDAVDMEIASFVAGIAIGTVLATLIVAFTAVGQYQRGYEAARRAIRMYRSI